MTLLRGKGLPAAQDTEPFFINSSPMQGVGLVSRVSPHQYLESETQNLTGIILLRTAISELEVDPFQITLWDRAVPLARAIDFGKARMFDPSDDHISAFSQLHTLDMLPARGLTEVDFWNLFSKCRSCRHFMTTRTIPYHICPTPGTELKLTFALNDNLKKRVYFMLLLDVHRADHSSGVQEDIFRAMFYVCRQCGRYMTQRVSGEHHEDADLGDYTCINSSLLLLAPGPANGADLKDVSITGKDRLGAAAQEFPALEPLYM
ncbi:hypothetical protein BDZ97DRAFT_1925084 [Flammula alnicola]|nr:hypothetical protein BDZ97DRAFT_1925084 [Flammula alnicola]